jgi:hypothetical protein
MAAVLEIKLDCGRQQWSAALFFVFFLYLNYTKK